MRFVQGFIAFFAFRCQKCTNYARIYRVPEKVPPHFVQGFILFFAFAMKMVQIMQGFKGCRKVSSRFVQGFIIFFAFGRLRKTSKSAKPRKTCVNCSFLRSRGGKFDSYIRKMYIFSILVAKMLFLHKENVYFQYWRTQNLIIT